MSILLQCRQWWDRPWLKALALAATLFVAYQPVWRAGFIWDDDSHVTQNPCVVGPSGFRAIWTSDEARICPLVLTGFRLQYLAWGVRPLPFHLFTLLMHVGAAIVLWRVLRLLNVPAPWLGAALWALHPVQVESVAWITELKNTQSGLFYMLTALFFVRARLAEREQDPGRSRRNDWAAWLFGAMAMASKSSTVVLPLTLGLCAWWIGQGKPRQIMLRLAPYVVMAAASSVLSLWTQQMEGLAGEEWARSWPERIAGTGWVVGFYLGKLLWPYPLIFIYPKWHIDPGSVLSYVPVTLTLAALVVLWLSRKRWSRGAFLAFAYFLAALVPVLGLWTHYFLRYSLVGDHFQYLASVGPLALAAAVLWRVLGAPAAKGDWRFPVVATVLLVALGATTWQRAGIFQDDKTLWQETLTKNSDCWMAHNNLGADLAARGELDGAIAHYLAAIALNPRHAQAHFNVGEVLDSQGKAEAATAHYLAAVEIKPDFAEAYNNLANLCIKRGDAEQGLRYAAEAVRLQPALAQAHYNRGNALGLLGKTSEAVKEFAAALALRADYPPAHYNLAVGLLQLGNRDEAASHFAEAVRLQPDNAAARANLAFVLAQQGKAPEAIREYQEALRLQPDMVEPLRNLALIRATHPDAQYRNGAEAVQLAERAVRLTQEQDPLALDALGAAWAETGDFSKAVAAADRAAALAAIRGNDSLRQKIATQRARYEAGQPWRE